MFKLEHKKMTVICGIVALILTAMNFFQYFGTFLIFLSNCVPAIIGVFMADYLYTYRKGYPEIEKVKTNWDWRGLVSVAAGTSWPIWAARHLPALVALLALWCCASC